MGERRIKDKERILYSVNCEHNTNLKVINPGNESTFVIKTRSKMIYITLATSKMREIRE